MRINTSDTARAAMVAYSLDNRCKCYLVDILFSQANDAPVSDEDHIAANSFGIGIRRWQGIKARLLRSGLVERVNGFLLCTALEVDYSGANECRGRNPNSPGAIRVRRWRQRKKEEACLETTRGGLND